MYICIYIYIYTIKHWEVTSQTAAALESRQKLLHTTPSGWWWWWWCIFIFNVTKYYSRICIFDATKS